MTDDKTPTNPGAMDPYAPAGYQLIPLHRWDRTSVHRNGRPRQDGKRPTDTDWVKRPYKTSDVLQHARNGNNVGVRLKASQLVVDVDPRNMPEGRNTFRELCEAVGLDPDDYPQVMTGSGGLHVYMAKPEDVPVVDSLEGYDGVEFKTKGRQVVAAGSKHPDGGMYEWDPLSPPLRDAGQAPERLLAMIRRPTRSQVGGATGGGEYDQVEVAAMLDALDPEDFRDHERWLTLMQACHHASGGEARSEFIEWSTRDDEYSGDAWIIGRRWDSLHRDRDGPVVTHRTLVKMLVDAGREDAVPRTAAEDDFEDDVELPGDDPLEDVPEHERLGPLGRMNTRYCVAVDAGRVRVFYEEYDPSEERKKWITLDKQNFHDLLANKRVERTNAKGEPELVPIAKAWWEWPHRRTARGVVFDPERDHPGYLNLWRGWAVDPAPGDWSLLRQLLHENLCDGDEETADYVERWMAYMVQKPWEPPGVAICFHGDKGTGKSTLGSALCALAGRHGKPLSSAEHITGRFNSHLQDVVMMFADEAVRPTDRSAQGKLKALITERELAYEGKGKDVKMARNRIHVMVASNHDWFVDAGATDGERRYMVARVNDGRRNDKRFFGRLLRQMYEQGGLAAMLHDLGTMDLEDWTPMGNVPRSEALVEQKLRNMEPVAQWWFNILDEGVMPFPTTVDTELWTEGNVRVFHQDLKEDFDRFCQRNRISPGSMNKSIDRYFWQELRKLCPRIEEKRDVVPEDRFDVHTPPSTNRARCMAFPSLEECRRDLETILEGRIWG